MSLFFKTPTIYKLSSVESIQDPETAFKNLPAKKAAPGATRKIGFVPLVRNSEMWFLEQQGAILFRCSISELKVPSKALKREIETGENAFYERTKQWPSKSESKVIEEAANTKLLAEAPEQITLVNGYIDKIHKTLVINSGNVNDVDGCLEVLRAAFGSLPCEPLIRLAKTTPAKIMSNWLLTDSLPGSLECGDSVKLATFSKPKMTASFSKIEPQHSDITNHITSEMLVSELSLSWAEKLSFKLSSDLSIKSVKFDGLLKSQASDDSEGGELSDLDATFNIQRNTFHQLLESMTNWFDITSKTE